MKRIMVRYKVKPDRAEENRERIRAVFDEARTRRLQGIRYDAFVLDDGVSFVHLFANERADGHNPLAELPAFKRFQAGIRERCEEPPSSASLEEVGAYRFSGEQ